MGTMTVGKSYGSGTVGRLMKRDQRALYRHWTDASPAKKISLGLLTLGAVALMLVVFGPWKLTWSDADAAIQVVEHKQSNIRAKSIQQEAHEPEITVSAGPVSVKMTPEQFQKEVEGAKRAVRNMGHAFSAMAAQSKPEYRKSSAYYNSLKKRGFNEDEQSFLRKGYPMHDPTALKLREQAVLLLREAPEAARIKVGKWAFGLKNNGKDATPLLRDICDQYDGPAIDKLRTLVAECVKAEQPI